VLLSCPQFGGPGPCALPQNAGNADVKGVELEFTATPFAGLQFDLSGSHLDWDWKCVNPQVADPNALPGQGCSSDPAVINLLSPVPIGFIKDQLHAGLQYEFGCRAGHPDPRLDASFWGAQTGSNTAAAAPPCVMGRCPVYVVNARVQRNRSRI
jgi:iron complex outermembrane receptor protein